MVERRQNRLIEIKKQEAPRNLKAERVRQINRFMMLDFHEELGMGRGEYFRSFPSFSEQPESYKERFDLPLLIDPRIFPKRQCRWAGILDHVDTDYVENTTIVPDNPYAIWTHDANPLRLEAVAGSTRKGSIYLRDNEVEVRLLK